MRRATAAGAVLAVAAAVLMVWLQPARASWWTFADPDGAYVGSSLNILLGNHTNYLDHPGLPTQGVLALAFGAEYVAGKATGEVILVGNYYFPIEDVRFGSLVDSFVDHVPEYPYRFVTQLRIVAERQLVPRYVVGGDELPDAAEVASIELDGRGPFVVEGLARRWGPEQQFRVARIVESPELDS